MDRQEENQNIADQDAPPTYESLPSSNQFNTTDDQLQADNIIVQFNQPAVQMSTLHNSESSQILDDPNATQPVDNSHTVLNITYPYDLPPSYSTLNISDLPPLYETLFPSFLSRVIIMLKQLYKGVGYITSSILTAIKYIYNLLPLENLQNFPYAFIIVFILLIFDAICFWWIKVLKNELQTMFNDEPWFIMNLFSIVLTVRALILLISLRPERHGYGRLILREFIILLSFHLILGIIFFQSYPNAFTILFHKNKF